VSERYVYALSSSYDLENAGGRQSAIHVGPVYLKITLQVLDIQDPNGIRSIASIHSSTLGPVEQTFNALHSSENPMQIYISTRDGQLFAGSFRLDSTELDIHPIQLPMGGAVRCLGYSYGVTMVAQQGSLQLRHEDDTNATICFVHNQLDMSQSRPSHLVTSWSLQRRLTSFIWMFAELRMRPRCGVSDPHFPNYLSLHSSLDFILEQHASPRRFIAVSGDGILIFRKRQPVEFLSDRSLVEYRRRRGSVICIASAIFGLAMTPRVDKQVRDALEEVIRLESNHLQPVGAERVIPDGATTIPSVFV
jgi:hypothetical protein